MTTVRNSLRAPRVKAPVIAGVVVLAVLVLSADGVARAYTDWLWFENLGLASVWTTIHLTQLALVATFSTLFFGVLWGNLAVADRLAPTTGAASTGASSTGASSTGARSAGRPAADVGVDDVVARYHRLIGDRGGRIRLVVAAGLALVAGANTASQWPQWLLFRNATSFGPALADPVFHRDPGFYMFRLPFLSFVIDWLFAALILTLIVVAVAHYLNGGIRATSPVDRVSTGVKAHLSALLAALALVRALGYWVDRFGLVNSTRGAYDGALATAVRIQWPAYNLLALVSVFVAVLFLANLRRQGWGLPAVAIGLWLVSHLLVGSVFPTLYQRLRVESQATTREAEFVQHNIDATRFAYGLDADRLTVEDLDYKPGLTAAEAADFSSVFDTVPLVDPSLARDSFVRSQGERAFYRFSEPLDIDRYRIDGRVRPVVLSVRGLDPEVKELDQGWEAQHIVFTHGYGAVMASGWDVDPSGRPRFVVSELGDVAIDPSLQERLGQPRVYFGEGFGGYAIVNAARDEVDFQTSLGQSRLSRYDGQGGVPLGGLVRRAAFALRFRQLDPLIAPTLTGQSQVVYDRDVAQRVRSVAPFLRFDSDPYPVLAQNRLFYVIDGYSTSDAYPYAQRVRGTSGDLLGTDLVGGYNYVRNSVKAVVDAYDGKVTLYTADTTDPVLRTWSKAFPGLFTDLDQMPADLLDNLRYPRDIFRVQSDMWSTYVVDDPVQLIQGDVAWSVAAQPRSEAQVGEGDGSGNSALMEPQYLMARLPKRPDPEYVLQRAFVPRSGGAGSNTARPELTGLMVARSEPGHLGELVVYKIPTAARVEAPDFVHSEIRKDDQLTEFVKEKLGSVVSFGEMSLVVVNDTIVYVRPVYVEAASATAVPELSRVIAVNGDRIAMGATLDEAVAAIADGAAPAVAPTSDSPFDAPDGSSGAGSTAPGGAAPSYDPAGKSVVELINDAEQLLRAADGAQTEGRLAEAAGLRAQANLALAAARNLVGGPTPTSRATPTSNRP